MAAAPSESVKFARFEAMRSDTVEIVIGDVVVRVSGLVEATLITTVLRALGRTS